MAKCKKEDLTKYRKTSNWISPYQPSEQGKYEILMRVLLDAHYQPKDATAIVKAWNDANRKAKMSTGLIQYPTGIYGLVGSIPIELTEEKPYHLGGTFRDSKHFQTKAEAHDALTALGYSTKDGINYFNQEVA